MNLGKAYGSRALLRIGGDRPRVRDARLPEQLLSRNPWPWRDDEVSRQSLCAFQDIPREKLSGTGAVPMGAGVEMCACAGHVGRRKDVYT